jgi:DNA-binding beta-propeller fold protein YncE
MTIRGTALRTLALLFIAATGVAAQSSPNPYRLVDDWAKLPGGREMGAVGKVTMDPDGRHLWAVIRCDAPGTEFGWECLESDLDPIIKFDLDGNVVDSFGGGLFIWPHGIDVDAFGNVWVTDAVAANRIPAGDTRGQQVIKFGPTGEVLLRLGTPGREGSGPNGFTSPSDVAVAANGDVFIADGHGNTGNNRVVKFTTDGRYLMEWGQTGYAPGEFRALHAIAIDDDGRVLVGDRSNNRIQIFDQQGSHLTTWTQFGRPSGIAFDEEGRIYVADSESDDVQNPGWEMGIRIGDARTGWVTEFIVYPWGDPRSTAGNGAEFVAVDPQGNIYGGEPSPRNLQKYMRVR